MFKILAVNTNATITDVSLISIYRIFLKALHNHRHAQSPLSRPFPLLSPLCYFVSFVYSRFFPFSPPPPLSLSLSLSLSENKHEENLGHAMRKEPSNGHWRIYLQKGRWTYTYNSIMPSCVCCLCVCLVCVWCVSVCVCVCVSKPRQLWPACSCTMYSSQKLVKAITTVTKWQRVPYTSS